MADTNNQYSFLDYAGLALFWSNIKKIIEDNELVTAVALTDLDTRLDDIEGVAAQSSPIIEKTYSELVELRNNDALIPGQKYRITDYITTTTQDNTQSASHPFDIIVLALSESKLSEQAWAVQSARDTDGYFANSKLSAWKIWYCLDNDTSRFAWADTANGKGVIYRMIDEWNNDCPYDFKNIQFKHPNDPVVYPAFYYTFSTVISEVVGDHSHNGGYCYGNAIGLSGGVQNQSLNRIVFINTSKTALCNSNSFDNNCNANSFGNNCHSNSFSNNCYSNSFGNYCYRNSFGNGSNSNSFGNYCNSNSFGNICNYNSFGNSCNYNSFGNSCSNNSFGNNCNSNSFGNSCNSNSFGNGCNSNSFGNNYYSNSFSNNCYSNSFGNYCYRNSFGNNCNANSFGNNCNSNSFGNDCIYNSFGNDCIYNSFRISGSKTSSLISYCRYNAFDDGCSYNIVYSPNTNSSNYLENYHINRGVKGTNANPMLIDAQYLNSENVCNVYRKGDVAVVAYIQY